MRGLRRPCLWPCALRCILACLGRARRRKRGGGFKQVQPLPKRVVAWFGQSSSAAPSSIQPLPFPLRSPLYQSWSHIDFLLLYIALARPRLEILRRISVVCLTRIFLGIDRQVSPGFTRIPCFIYQSQTVGFSIPSQFQCILKSWQSSTLTFCQTYEICWDWLRWTLQGWDQMTSQG